MLGAELFWAQLYELPTDMAIGQMAKFSRILLCRFPCFWAHISSGKTIPTKFEVHQNLSKLGYWPSSTALGPIGSWPYLLMSQMVSNEEPSRDIFAYSRGQDAISAFMEWFDSHKYQKLLYVAVFCQILPNHSGNSAICHPLAVLFGRVAEFCPPH